MHHVITKKNQIDRSASTAKILTVALGKFESAVRLLDADTMLRNEIKRKCEDAETQRTRENSNPPIRSLRLSAIAPLRLLSPLPCEQAIAAVKGSTYRLVAIGALVKSENEASGVIDTNKRN